MKTYTVEWSCADYVYPERSPKNSGRPGMTTCGGLSKIAAESAADALIAIRSQLGKKSNVTGEGSRIKVLED